MKRLALALLLVCGVAQADLTSNLVLHYSFEDNLTDSAPGGHNAANQGSGTDFTYETGKVGKCLKFYNSNYAIVNDFAGLDGMGDLTLSVWIKRVDTDAWENNSAYNKSVMRVRVEYNTNDGEYTFVVADSDGTEVTLTSTGDAAKNTNWNNVLVTHNGTVLKLYVNGTELDSQTPGNWSGTLYDGGNPAGIGEAGDLYVDELRIYNRVLTSGEISELAGEGSSTPTPTMTNTVPTPTYTNTATPTPTTTNSPTPTPTITNTITSTKTQTPTPTPTYKVYRVKKDGTGDSTTIQGAVDIAPVNSSIVVYDGVYSERIDWRTGLNGTLSNRYSISTANVRGATCYGFTLDRGGDYTTISGFVITTTTDETQMQHGVWSDRTYVTVTNCYFYDIIGYAVDIGTSPPYTITGTTITDNTAYKCSGGYYAAGTSSLIEDNTSERLYKWLDHGFPNALGDNDHCRIFGDNSAVRHNVFFGTLESEIGTSHVDCVQTYDNIGDYGANTIIEDNYCEAVDEGIMLGDNSTGSHDNFVVRNNVFHDMWSWGVLINKATGVQVYNNTFTGSAIHGVGTQSGGTAHLENNIFSGITNTSAYFHDELSDITGNNNLLYKSGTTIPQSEYPDDIVNQDPLFVGYSSNNFRLGVGSPAIDSGVSTAASTDINGVARPFGAAFDIGAYEYFTDTAPSGGKTKLKRHRFQR